jgi:ring-1,2-phenylacetyl-CoA epoxidase subunit PaaD
MVATVETIWAILETVTDPEIPVLTVVDLGIVRDVQIHDDDTVEVVITPTYSGCPAMQTIEVHIIATLQEQGFDKIKVTTVLSPAWTTDWLTESGKAKLKAYGIAPPVGRVSKRALFGEEPSVECPNCSSKNTELLSQFGSTACKSLYRCKDCLEPFDYFKCH